MAESFTSQLEAILRDFGDAVEERVKPGLPGMSERAKEWASSDKDPDPQALASIKHLIAESLPDEKVYEYAYQLMPHIRHNLELNDSEAK